MSDKLFELRRRTFDTPHFRGIEFIETEAKSILNKVPGNYLPFNWTINVYRGCSHACSYCIEGETPILMADGRTKAIADLKVGDEIYGTVRRGNYRRYTKTEVLAHWSTLKRAYRVVLEDETTLIASGDHRFLTNRGWKHVASTGDLSEIQDPMKPGDLLIGTVENSDALMAADRYGVVDVVDLDTEIPMFDITTGTGDFIADGVVSHNCFARATHTFLDMGAGRDFETKIVVKTNAPQLVRKELRAKRWKGETVAMGTNTDPYQRAEGKYKLTRGVLEALLEVRNPFSILTKGTLIMRDIDILEEAAEIAEVSTAFSIPTLDEDVWRKSEPGTPHPRKRVEVVRKLNETGVPCGVLVAPILPGISDRRDQLREVVTACLDAGATFVSPILLHLRPKVREVYMEWLGEEFPELVPRYVDMYPKAYAAKGDQDSLRARVAAIVAEHPRKTVARRKRPRRRTSAPREATEQLSLL